MGILKRLRGAPISRHTAEFGHRYNPQPPYNLLCSKLLDFATLRRLERFARYWDLIANSGRFHHTRPLLLGDQPFERFMTLSDWLFAATGQTHQFALARLFDWLYHGLTDTLALDEPTAREALTKDYQRSGDKASPHFLRSSAAHAQPQAKTAGAVTLTRQGRHYR